MMGLHPCSVKEDYKDVLAGLKGWLDKRRYAAIGEIGIDLYWDKTTLDIQVDAFKIQLGWANEYNLPISIHSRDSTREILDMLSENREILTGGVMHCFTETWDVAEAVLAQGFHISLSGIVTFKNALSIKDVARRVPLDRLLIETDSPYLAPMPYRGKTNQPGYVKYVAEEIAHLRNISFEEVAKATTDNFFRLFPHARTSISQ